MEIDSFQYNMLKEKAEKWDIISNSGILEHIKNIMEDLQESQTECSCLQQFVIDNADNGGVLHEDYPHIKCATNRLFGITQDILYNKYDLNYLF